MNSDTLTYDYRGKRGVVLLRVSTEEQERKYGLPSQLRSIREKLLEPLGIRILDEEKYIVRDTYTGMEFRERAELVKILEMAKRKEFDVLVMDVLDRLGRTGLPREIYRAELRMHGVRILTTKPEEHADDDSLMGQMIRLLHGFKSEQERNDIVRRTMNGTRERIVKDHKLPGGRDTKYGWKCPNGNRDACIVNEDPLMIGEMTLYDEKGKSWTEAKVIRHMFYMADNGHTIRGIGSYLTQQHIPTRRGAKWDIALVKQILMHRDRYLSSEKPVLAYGFLETPYTEASIARLIDQLAEEYNDLQKVAACLTEKQVPTGREAYWHPSSVSRMLEDEYVIGKAAVYKMMVVREEGSKPRQIPRDPSEWVYLPEGVVPPILVTEDGKPDIALFERVQKLKEIRQLSATRNNQKPYNYLLRGGYIKCGYCGGNMTVGGIGGSKRQGLSRMGYRCLTAANSVTGANRCPSLSKVTIEAYIPDDFAWSAAVEIIRDPSEVDRKLEAWKTEDPNAERRQHITEELAKIKARRARLAARLEDEDLDDETYADVKLRLKELAEQKKGYEKELSTEINMYDEWLKMQEKLDHFHKRCQEMREQLDDPEFKPDYDFKRQAIEFFGLVARVWKTDHNPRIAIESNPPSIVSNSVYRMQP